MIGLARFNVSFELLDLVGSVSIYAANRREFFEPNQVKKPILINLVIGKKHETYFQIEKFRDITINTIITRIGARCYKYTGRSNALFFVRVQRPLWRTPIFKLSLQIL